MADWRPDLSNSDKPRYLAIADAIADDIAAGRLVIGDRLPPQRKLAKRLDVDFTTVARGYVEAQKRGLIESKVGQGTFVRDKPRPRRSATSFPPRPVDLSMNLPPEPDDPELIERMQAGTEHVLRDIVPLLRYQGFGGTQADKDAASSWLGRRALVPAQSRIFVSPGAHPALLGILSILAKSGEVVLCEAITYPGIRSIAAQLGITLVGLPMDGDGIEPQALTDACKKLKPKAIYLNPTLQNPTTLTIPDSRRREIVAIARRFKLPIIEDDAYGFIPEHGHGHAPFAAIAPDLTWHVAGLAKCIGARYALGLAVCLGAPVSDRDGLPPHRGDRDALDRRRHRGHDVAVHPRRDFGAAEARRRNPAQGVLSRRSAELQSVGCAARSLEPVGFRGAYAPDRYRCGRKRRLCRERSAARGRESLHLRSFNPGAD
jgi:DNA-binding transcriptional MocR family regulator